MKLYGLAGFAAMAICIALTGCGEGKMQESASGIVGEPISIVEPSQTEKADQGSMIMGDYEMAKSLYEGTWICNRASLSLEFMGEGNIRASILWANSAMEMSEWDYHCRFDGIALVDDGSGKRLTVDYSSEDGTPVTTEVYSNGTARFEIGVDGMLTWKDFIEDAGAGMTFEKYQVGEVKQSGDEAGYAGTYIDEEGSDCTLFIQYVNGTEYTVNISIFRLTELSGGKGELKADGLHFMALDAAGNPIGGVITVWEGKATVLFTDSTWELLPNGTSLLYTRQE